MTEARNDVVLPRQLWPILMRILDFIRNRGLKRLGQWVRKGIAPRCHLAPATPTSSTGLPPPARAHHSSGHDEHMLNIEAYIALARTLQPCFVVLEDVDLVGRSREDISGQKANARSRIHVI